MTDLETEIKQLIVSTLCLEDINPEDIESGDPLFGDGLGLDSIDALELGVALRKKFNVTINSDDAQVRESFGSVSSLAKFINSQRV